MKSAIFVCRFAVVVASKYRMLVNEHDTRRFIALYVEDNRDQILILIEKVNQALRLFQQPSYYQVIHQIYQCNLARF